MRKKLQNSKDYASHQSFCQYWGYLFKSVATTEMNYIPSSLDYKCTQIFYIYNYNIQVNKKAFEINAKIEDVGLNED